MRLAHRGAASRDSIKQNRFYPKSRLEGFDFALAPPVRCESPCVGQLWLQRFGHFMTSCGLRVRGWGTDITGTKMLHF